MAINLIDIPSDKRVLKAWGSVIIFIFYELKPTLLLHQSICFSCDWSLCMLLMVHSFYYILITNHNELTPFHPKNSFFPSFVVKNDNIMQLPSFRSSIFSRWMSKGMLKEHSWTYSKKPFSFLKNYLWFQFLTTEK